MQTFWFFGTVLATLVLSLVGCDTGSSESSHTASIFGRNDLVPVTKDARQDVSTAVGSLAVVLEVDGERSFVPHCTAIRLGENHLLTAAHCVHDKLIFNPWMLVKNDASQDSSFEIQRFGDVLRLSYSGELDDQSQRWSNVAPILPQPLVVNESLDFAIYELDCVYVDELRRLGPGLELPTTFEAPQALTIWGHPNGVPLAKANCKSGYLVEGAWFFHDCDALSGSSGGLISDPATHSPVAMQLAGPARNSGNYYSQHGTFESPEEFAQRRGCGPVQANDPDSAACVTRRGLNRAVPLFVIAADLASKNPDIVSKL